MPSSSRVATTSAGAVSQNRSECNTARTLWRSASDSACGGRARDSLAVDTGGRRRRYSVAREIPSARQAWAAPRSGATASTAVTSRALLVVAGRVERDPQQLGDFSLISMIFSACASRLARRSLARRSRSTSTRVGSAGLGRACAPGPGAPPPRALAAPIDQVRGVQPLAAQQRADLARLGAGVGLTQDRELVLGAEAPPLAFRHLGIGWAGHGLRIDPGPGCRHRHGHELGVLPLALVTEYRGRSVSAHAGREAKDTDTLTKARPASAPPGPPCPAGARWATPPCLGQRLRGLATMTARRWATCQHETASRTTSQLLGLPAKPRLGALLSSDNFGSSVGRSSGRHVLWQRWRGARVLLLGGSFQGSAWTVGWADLAAASPRSGSRSAARRWGPSALASLTWSACRLVARLEVS